MTPVAGAMGSYWRSLHCVPTWPGLMGHLAHMQNFGLSRHTQIAADRRSLDLCVIRVDSTATLYAGGGKMTPVAGAMGSYWRTLHCVPT